MAYLPSEYPSDREDDSSWWWWRWRWWRWDPIPQQTFIGATSGWCCWLWNFLQIALTEIKSSSPWASWSSYTCSIWKESSQLTNCGRCISAIWDEEMQKNLISLYIPLISIPLFCNFLKLSSFVWFSSGTPLLITITTIFIIVVSKKRKLLIMEDVERSSPPFPHFALEFTGMNGKENWGWMREKEVREKRRNQFSILNDFTCI